MQTKKIILFTNTLHLGGGERSVSILSLNLPKHIKPVIVLFQKKITYPYRGKIISLRIKETYNNHLSLIVCLIIGWWRFRKIVRQEKPDWVISLGNSPNIINALVNYNPIIRVGNALPKSTSKAIRLRTKIFIILAKLLFKRAKKIITISKGLQKDLIENFHIPAEKIKLIYNQLDRKKINKLSKQPLSVQYAPLFQNQVIINIGRISKQKGQWHLIRAFSKVADQVPKVKLVIIGIGIYEKYIKKLIADLDLSSRVYLIGWQNNPYQFLRQSDLFVLSSLWEGLSMATLEAIVCGLPIVACDCTWGPRDIIAPNTQIPDSKIDDIEQGECGILTPVCDGTMYSAKEPLTKEEEMLAQAMVILLKDQNKLALLAQKSLQRAQNFDISDIPKQYNFL